MKYIRFILIFLIYFLLVPLVQAQTEVNWPTLAGNPQRSSWTSEEVRGPFNPLWYVPLDPYIDNKSQIIAANDTIFVSTAKGLYAFNAADGSLKWVYGTQLPLGHTPTVAFVNNKYVVYAPGYDHRIHAIDATTGQALAGYTPYEAGAAFEVNPLVINNTIYAGNKDGKFYAFNALSGAKVWEFVAKGPIRYSAAYSAKYNTLYFAADDSHAYALNAATGTRIWQSPASDTERFPGVGFDMYWPVIYTEPTTNREYVIFTGSKKGSFQWFVSGVDMFHQENYEGIYGSYSSNPACGSGFNHDPSCLCGPTGFEPYQWLSGATTTPTVKCDAIYNYFNTASNWGSQKPWKRFTFILDQATGTEITPYAPFNPSPHDGGGQGYRHPPIIGPDQVLYAFIGYYAGGNAGAHGGIAGWKFGTSHISRTRDFLSGQSDEPVTYNGGGNIIYYGEGVNADGFGAYEINRPMGSNTFWSLGIVSSPLLQGIKTKYTDIGLQGKFGGSNGAYTYFDGVLSQSPIPYKGKLYVLNANILFALSSAPMPSNALKNLVPAPSAVVTPPISITKADIQQRITQEVQKIIAAGHLRPGFHDSGGISYTMSGAYNDPIPGNHLNEYFHNPSDTIVTLVQALPYLSSTLQTQVKTYLQTHYGPGATYDITRVAHIGWKGAARESFDDTPEMITQTINSTYDANNYAAANPRTCIHMSRNLRIGNNTNTNCPYDSGFPPESFYGAWKYAQTFPGTAATIFNLMKTKLSNPDQTGTTNDMTNANLIRYPYLLNEYLVGFYGYLQLEKLAGVTSDITQSTKYAEYQRLLNLRLTNYSKDSPFGDVFDFNNGFNAARNFIHLMPELADILRTNKLTAVQDTINHFDVVTPYWFVTRYNRSYSESYSQHLHDFSSLFQARARSLQTPYNELVKYLDVPAFERGDLFYIQNLVASYEAPTNGTITPTPLPGDYDNDGNIDFIDLKILLTTPFTIFDINRLMQLF